MSDLSCDRQVILNDYLDEGALDNLYVYTGAAGRIANKYTYEDGAHVEILEDERSKRLVRSIPKSFTKNVSNTHFTYTLKMILRSSGRNSAVTFKNIFWKT